MKRIVALFLMLALLISSAVALTSCDVIDTLLGTGENENAGNSTETDEIELSGTYLRVVGTPCPEITFDNGNAEIKLGKRSMSGTYKIYKSESGYEIVFDFGSSTSLIGGVGSGTYPISVGTHKGIDYLMLFGTRYDKQ